jgi:hypothetical protein
MMVTFEDVTEMFLNAAEDDNLTAHPEFWLNTQTLEREFVCVLHACPCEESEDHPTCQVSFSWGALDTVLSYDGAEGICEFFHEPDEECTHLRTDNVPPLPLDMAYSAPLDHASLGTTDLAEFSQRLRWKTSEQSQQGQETRSNFSFTFGGDGGMLNHLVLEQHVELKLWDPGGLSGIRSANEFPGGHEPSRRSRSLPNPEDWLPQIFREVIQDVRSVIRMLEDDLPSGGFSGGMRHN